MPAAKKVYTPGQKIGNMIFIKETEPKEYTCGKFARHARFLCECGGEIVTNINSVRIGSTKSCGCMRAGKWNGLSYHPLFKHFGHIRTRCTNPKHSDYKYYGGRGIIMCDEWIANPQNFIDYITTLENFGVDGYGSIDRRDNDGNYEPGNLRWATQSMQMQNTSRPKSKTGYVGVYYKKRHNRFRADVYHNGKRVHVGHNYKTAMGAAVARDQYILDHGLNIELQVLINH